MNAQNATINPMCIDCAKYGGSCPGTSCRVWTGCVCKQRTDPAKTICKPRLIIDEASKGTDFAYNVQLWHSYDGGKTFYYSGYGRFFSDYYEAEAWRKQQRKNLAYDLMFCHFGNGITVCNRAREEHGDYQKVAHISTEGVITWYISRDKLTAYALEDIEQRAAAIAENSPA